MNFFLYFQIFYLKSFKDSYTGIFLKKSANLQQKRVNVLCYSVIQVLQICCRLWVFVADYGLFWPIVGFCAEVFSHVRNCNTARYVGWHGTPNRSTRHAWLRNEARCVGWWGTLWPLLCLSACVLTKLNIAITLFIFFRLVDREESSNFAPEIIKMK